MTHRSFVSFYSSELFQSPIRTTQCGHNFCEKCLNDIFDNGHLGHWACPECRQEHNCPVNSLPRCFLIEKMVEKVKKQGQASTECEFGSCLRHRRMIEYREFKSSADNFYLWYNLECLTHGNDLCADCLMHKICGNNNQTEKCDFMKKSQAKKLAQDQILKTQGKLKNSESDYTNYLKKSYPSSRSSA